ncbi:replication protein O [Klebsiella pneumoniae]|nr:replication protein O [Klebsiella pneumoniae]
MSDANLIRTFWSNGEQNRNAIWMVSRWTWMVFRDYLRYIAQNCRWMLEGPTRQKSGKTWRRMKFDKFLSGKTSTIEVSSEGDRDDR